MSRLTDKACDVLAWVTYPAILTLLEGRAAVREWGATIDTRIADAINGPDDIED